MRFTDQMIHLNDPLYCAALLMACTSHPVPHIPRQKNGGTCRGEDRVYSSNKEVEGLGSSTVTSSSKLKERMAGEDQGLQDLFFLFYSIFIHNAYSLS